MRPLHAAALLAPILLAGCAAPTAAVRPADLDRLTGPRWSGTLTYRDYASGREVSIPAAIDVAADPSTPRQWTLALSFPGEPHADSADIITLSGDGREIDGKRVIERAALPDGALRIIAEERGTDDGRPARLRTVYLLAPRTVTVSNLVLPDGETTEFTRNTLSVMR